jgi:hypothetical protein
MLSRRLRLWFKGKRSGATRKRLTPFAADSGFAAEGMRRVLAKVWVGEGVLPAPPLPLKPTVGRMLNAYACAFSFYLQLVEHTLEN